MNSRERVRLAINHREPDRLPIDIGGTRVTGVHADLYVKIGAYLGLDTELPKVYSLQSMLARMEGEVRNWFGSDVINLENPRDSWGVPNEDWKIWITNQGNRVLVPGKFNIVKKLDGSFEVEKEGVTIAKMADSSIYFDRVTTNKVKSITDDIEFANIEKFKQSIERYTEEDLRKLEKNAKFLYENTEYSLHGSFMKGHYGNSAGIAHHSFVEWLMIMLAEPEYAQELIGACEEAALENLEIYLQAVGKYIDTLLMSSIDFGTQNCEMFSPDIFDELYKPSYRNLNTYVHQHSDVKVMYHSCGSIYNLIPMFIEAGTDILNPVQTTCNNMDFTKLKEEFGDKITFWGGGVETQTILPYGTKEEVENHVRNRVEIGKKNGGFIFAAIHNLQPDIPLGNLEVMIETVKKYGVYENRV